MSDSILTSTKRRFGLSEDSTDFDLDITMDINTALMELGMLGVEKGSIKRITDKTSNWSDFIGIDDETLEAVKTYVYLRVKLSFDPPQTNPLIQSINNQLLELAWRINVRAEGGS